MSRLLEYLELLRQFVQRSPIVFWSTLGLLALTGLLFVFLPARQMDNAATSREPSAERGQPGNQSKGLDNTNTTAQTPPGDGREGSSLKPGGSKSGGGFTVQVASFASEDAARQMASKLKASGYPAFVKAAQVPGKGRTYRVRVGAFATREEAQRYGARLKTKEDSVKSIFATIND